jgi:hypothetical protein
VWVNGRLVLWRLGLYNYNYALHWGCMPGLAGSLGLQVSRGIMGGGNIQGNRLVWE